MYSIWKHADSTETMLIIIKQRNSRDINSIEATRKCILEQGNAWFQSDRK